MLHHHFIHSKLIGFTIHTRTIAQPPQEIHEPYEFQIECYTKSHSNVRIILTHAVVGPGIFFRGGGGGGGGSKRESPSQ